ncbi:hypothetical protein MAR_017371 [Mya arenaria]|uniref:Uncharacterized protein n=1 Tax=Mya arenaria TaxID=6604 RepID=A0ABY7EC81_MYAAR|nr:hypothetical protein MAR_016687 [Mya arenaria]WAR07413.1 hypothetical protein MAR_017371 [Mya arenaria]
MEKGQGENPPPYDEQQAQNSQNQPQVQYVQPQNSQGQPQYGQGQPQYGHGQPQYGHGQPQYGTGQPQYGHGQPQYGPGPGHQGQHFGPPPPGQVVYIQQPVHGAHPSTGEQNMANARERGRTYGHGGWSNHLCGCFNNIHLALSALIVPCATYGQTAEHAGDYGVFRAHIQPDPVGPGARKDQGAQGHPGHECFRLAHHHLLQLLRPCPGSTGSATHGRPRRHFHEPPVAPATVAISLFPSVSPLVKTKPCYKCL